MNEPQLIEWHGRFSLTPGATWLVEPHYANVPPHNWWECEVLDYNLLTIHHLVPPTIVACPVCGRHWRLTGINSEWSAEWERVECRPGVDGHAQWVIVDRPRKWGWLEFIIGPGKFVITR